MIIGIDLGTTNSSVSAFINEELQLIPNSFAEVLTPSVVSFDEDGTYYVGAVAKERLVTHPETTFKEFKRDMGSDRIYKAFDESHTPEELSALVLKQLKADAEKFTGETIKDAVISVPAYFSDKQRAATRNAGLIAGLNVICLINEPSAAALTYHANNMDEDETYLVFDFGGGTLDVTLVDAFDNIIEIQSISGDNYLGGADFNKAIAIDICAKNNIKWSDLDASKKAILLNHGEEIKIALTAEVSCKHTIYLDGKAYNYSLDRQGLLDISGDIFNRITIVLKRIMNDAGLAINDIDGVIMIGGSSKMPVVQLFINSLFQGNTKYERNGDVIVCEGAGIVAGIKSRNDKVRDLILTDIAPFSLGTKVADGSFSVIVPKNQVLPCSKVEYYSNAGDFQKEVNFKIYQGENIIADKNELLTTINLKIEPRPAGQVCVAARFSYDINGIFDVEITGDGLLENKTVHLGNAQGLSEAEIEAKRQNLERIRENQSSSEKSRLLIEKASRLAAECNLEQRKFLEAAIRNYLMILESAGIEASRKAGEELQEVVDQVEKSMFSFSEFDANLWKEYIEGSMGKDDKED
ncbi:molecular chaperone HscC [Pseudobutyrivibrio sp. YE44]|uniref:Hsp70 family protein n=1 Tax=Pseudobutyrivibrio sp. YE44 TaxID=1520802 RepID=UPI00088DC97F|nr:Hsp70 family protein [Pseudobutyrivibrio sp. YE44]SDB29280.1 molecular chaperone HscC [Pseudobutyrivibrio sp. YE44]